MTTYQDIETRVQEVANKVAEMAYMTKEQIFGTISEAVWLSDELNNFTRSLDIQIAEKEKETLASALERKTNASMAKLMVNQETAALKADRQWAERQISLLRDIKMAALSAQRSAED